MTERPDPAKVIAEAREKNPHERLHPAWAGTEHVAWEDGFDAAVAALAAAGFPVGEPRDVLTDDGGGRDA